MRKWVCWSDTFRISEEHGYGVRTPCRSSRRFSIILKMISEPRMEQEFAICRDITALKAEISEPVLVNRHFCRELAGDEHPPGNLFHKVFKKYYN